MKKKHLSWSSISMAMRCGEQFRRRYVLGERRPPGIAMIVGSSVHRSVEHNMSSVIDVGEHIGRGEAADIARDAIDERLVKDGVVLTDDEKSRGFDVIKGEAKDKSINLSLVHYDDAAPAIAPVTVERKWRIESDDLEYDLVGRLDIETKGGIRDTKTSGKSPNQQTVDSMDQFTMYSIAFQVLNNRWPETLVADYLIALKASSKYMPIETVRTQANADALFRRITAVQHAIKSESFVPADRGWWGCDPRYCGYYSDCPYV